MVVKYLDEVLKNGMLAANENKNKKLAIKFF